MKNREDWLVDQLDNANLSESIRTKYETELEAIAKSHTKAQERREIAESLERARRAEIRARLEAQDLDFTWALGEEEFKDDYEICEEGDQFILYSKVANDDQNHRRPHSTLEAAKKDLRYLYYNRLYTKCVRTGEADAIVNIAS